MTGVQTCALPISRIRMIMHRVGLRTSVDDRYFNDFQLSLGLSIIIAAEALNGPIFPS